jgi:hypothetical protein
VIISFYSPPPITYHSDVLELLPDEVKISVARSRSVRMLQSSLGRSFRPSRPICTTTAAIWLEGKVFEALCAVAIQSSNYVNTTTQQASLNSALPVTASKSGSGSGSGDTMTTAQGAGSAFNRYLANVTRLTFALQVLSNIALHT